MISLKILQDAALSKSGREKMQFPLFQKKTLGAVFGNTLEWYDFVLYGSLAPFISQHFFPLKNHLASLMLTFAVFAVGFLFRPIGGIIFSHFGDTRSRSKTLIVSIVLMCIPTILIGLIPSYHTIGMLCPVLVVIIRLLQGLSVGGGYVGSMSYLTEIAPKGERGFYSSFVQIGLFSGILIGPIVIKIVMGLTTAKQFAAWGWRIPFISSILLGIIAYFLCRGLIEPQAFVKNLKEKSKVPLITCFEKYKAPLLIGFFLSSQVGIPFWLIMVYSTTYFSKILHAPFAMVETQNLYAILLALIVTPLIGRLTKRVSAWTILFICSIGFIVLSYVMNIILVQHLMGIQFYLAHFLMVFFTAAYLAAFAGYMASLFPTAVRYSGIAFSYNVSLAIFGGFAPLVVTAMIKNGILLAPGILLTLSGVMAFVALLFARRYSKY